MPVNERDLELRNMQEPQSTMSKAELRKTHKPIMEKRRRARINHCLNEIKSLILEAMNKDPARHSKLEKADILEMAVRHLQNVQRQQLALAMASDPSVLRKFRNGFNECASEINGYINQLDGIDDTLKQSINSHLSKCINGIEQVAHFNFPGFSNAPFLTTPTVINLNQSQLDSPRIDTDDQNNNPRVPLPIPQGIHVIPSRLPTGELALLLPNSSNLPYFSSPHPHSNNNTSSSSSTNTNTNTARENQRRSAFVAVVPSATSTGENITSPRLMETPELVEESSVGFRPIKSLTDTGKDCYQDHQVTTTSFQKPPQHEVKSIRFPIHNYQQEKKVTTSIISTSPKKVEALSVITNQNERYKQAQVKEDFVHLEENYPAGVGIGSKRKLEESVEVSYPKMYKSVDDKLSNSEAVGVRAAQSFCDFSDRGQSTRPQPQLADGAGAGSGSSSDAMWRPW